MFRRIMHIPQPMQWELPPERPALVEQTIQVWRLSMEDSAAAGSSFLEVLSKEERDRAGQFKFEKDARHFAASRACLRVILSNYLGAPPQDLQIEHGEYGKPRLRRSAFGDVRFNLSHSGNLTLLSVALGREVGLDIEKIRPFPDAQHIAGRFFTSAEQEALRHLAGKDLERGFFRCWTRKEAYLKARGRGVGLGLDRFEVPLAPDREPELRHLDDELGDARDWWIMDLEPGPGYVGALAAEGTPSRLQLWDFSYI
jgi:4'-phosphopantetheinyl transferase